MQKKKWTKPQLVVLVRGKPEEAVLDVCKGDYTGPRANDPVGGDCMYFISDICSGYCDTNSAT